MISFEIKRGNRPLGQEDLDSLAFQLTYSLSVTVVYQCVLMALSQDTIVGIIALFLALPPVLFGFWKLVRKRQESSSLPLYEYRWYGGPIVIHSKIDIV